ncbi:MAG: metal-dependent hydrolase, partial [Nanoarchaeota archaeon]
MPEAVTHFLIAAIVVNLIRDFLIKNKSAFPLHLVLIGGLAGLLPDFDIGVYWVLGFFGFSVSQVHRTFSHTLWVPILFFVLSFVFWKYKSSALSRRKLSWSNVLFVLGVGTFIHIILDAVFIGSV